MTIPAHSEVVVTGDRSTDHTSYVDWPAIIGGIVVASAISLLLLTFGSAIGLSFVDFRAGEGTDPMWIAIAAALWLLWVQVSSFMAGAYLTGRLRHRHHDASEDESDVRDGAHGVLVWAGALIVGAVLATAGLGAAARTAGDAIATVTGAASNIAGGAAESLDPNAYFIDTLFRPATGAAPADAAATTPAAPATATPAAPGATPATPTTTPVVGTAAAMPAAMADMGPVRAEVGRIFARSLTGDEIPADDRTYLGQLVAQNTGLPEAEANARVDQVVTAIETARTEAAEIAEAARKSAVVAAFLTAAALLVSAVGAFWAAQKGGNHRDENTVFGTMFKRF